MDTCVCVVFFFFKQKTAYEMRISDWSSDVCSSDLLFRRNWRSLERGTSLSNPLLERQAIKLHHPSPFALSLSKGRSFFQRRKMKDGASTSSARTEER